MKDQSKSESGNGQTRRGSEKGIEVDLVSPGESIGVETSSTKEGFVNHPHLGGETVYGKSARFSSGTPGTDYVDMARQYGGRVYEGVSQVMRELPERSRTLARDVDVQVRNNPWLSTAVVGIGSLLIGYLFGRSLLGRSVQQPRSVPIRPSGLGYGYDDLDEAIDE